MIDIEERLRNMRARLRFAHQEIEQLRDENERLKRDVAYWDGTVRRELALEVERLQNEPINSC